MKPTPHLLVAAVLVVVGLFATASALIGGAGSYPIPVRDLRVVGPATDTKVVPAERATGPLVADLSAPPASNPFSARRDFRSVELAIGQPPPPRVEYPALPVLPVVTK
jgi:hypothetical protein